MKLPDGYIVLNDTGYDVCTELTGGGNLFFKLEVSSIRLTSTSNIIGDPDWGVRVLWRGRGRSFWAFL